MVLILLLSLWRARLNLFRSVPGVSFVSVFLTLSFKRAMRKVAPFLLGISAARWFVRLVWFLFKFLHSLLGVITIGLRRP